MRYLVLVLGLLWACPLWAQEFEQVNTTSPQTLENKTLTSPSLTTPTLTSPTITGTISGGATITAPTITNPTITGTVAGGASYTAPTLTTPTLTTPTITNPTITGTVAGGATYTAPTLTTPTLTTPTLTDATISNAILTTPKQLHADVVTPDNYASLAAAFAALTGNTKTLLVMGATTLATNATCPAGTTMVLWGSSQITVSGGVAMTLNCTVIAAPRQVFAGAGSVVFGNANTPSYPVEWYGTTTAQQQAALDGLASGQTLIANGTYTTTGLTLTNKSHVRITGKGSFTLNAAASGAMIFKLVGTLDDVEIDNLRLIGENNSGYTQTGIGNDSGQTISNVRFHDLAVSNINVGISLNAYLGGTYSKGHIYRNYLDNIIGQTSGQGYGIHVASATNSEISHNHVNQAQRHSIYQAYGTSVNNRYIGNLITNHRQAVTDGSLRAAFVISRSSGVTAEANIIDNFYDSGMEISHVTSTSDNTSEIDIKGNVFSNRHTSAYALFVGEQQVPTTNITSGVRITDNTFTAAYSDVTTSPDVQVLNGRNVSIKGNTFQRSGVTATAKFIGIGHASYISVDTDCDYTYVTGNDFLASGAVLTDVRAVEYDDTPVNTSHHWMTGNRFKDVALYTYMTATRTNPNLIWEGDIGGREGVYTAADTTPSVKGVSFLSITNAGAVSITTLDDGEENQIITLFFNDANTTIVDGATMQLSGGANFVGTANDTLTLRKRSTVWYEVSRGVN